MARPTTCDCGSCATCRHRVYMRRWQAAHPGYAAAAVRRRRAEHPEELREYDRDRWHHDREFRRRKRARNRVSTALARGELVRADACESCGAERFCEAHHADYSRPLDVTWLCRDCHHAVHVPEALI